MGIVKDRYCIIQNYFGKFDDKSIIAYTYDYQNAYNLWEILCKDKEGRPFSYEIKRCYTYKDLPQDEYDERVVSMSEFEVYEEK